MKGTNWISVARRDDHTTGLCVCWLVGWLVLAGVCSVSVCLVVAGGGGGRRGRPLKCTCKLSMSCGGQTLGTAFRAVRAVHDKLTAMLAEWKNEWMKWGDKRREMTCTTTTTTEKSRWWWWWALQELIHHHHHQCRLTKSSAWTCKTMHNSVHTYRQTVCPERRLPLKSLL